MWCDTVNRDIYGLWQENHSSARKEYFGANKKLVLWSIVAVWVIAILLCVAGQLLGELVPEHAVEWAMIAVVAVASKANVTQCLPTSPYS